MNKSISLSRTGAREQSRTGKESKGVALVVAGAGEGSFRNRIDAGTDWKDSRRWIVAGSSALLGRKSRM